MCAAACLRLHTRVWHGCRQRLAPAERKCKHWSRRHAGKSGKCWTFRCRFWGIARQPSGRCPRIAPESCAAHCGTSFHAIGVGQHACFDDASVKKVAIFEIRKSVFGHSWCAHMLVALLCGHKKVRRERAHSMLCGGAVSDTWLQRFFAKTATATRGFPWVSVAQKSTWCVPHSAHAPSNDGITYGMLGHTFEVREVEQACMQVV